MISKQSLKSERIKHYATGYCTVGTITTYDATIGKFTLVYVGKVRGTIITDNHGNWKFDTPEAAREAAQWFRQHAQDMVTKFNY